jgi:hypothetical protein
LKTVRRFFCISSYPPVRTYDPLAKRPAQPEIVSLRAARFVSAQRHNVTHFGMHAAPRFGMMVKYMFFRREKPHEATFAERIEALKKLGFTADLADPRQAVVSRDGISAVLEDGPGQHSHVDRAGMLVNREIAALVNGGYQMFWRTASGRTIPALAVQLKNLHNFEEDLKEGLGLTSLYNESLGTTSDLHLYDRVEHRDDGAPHKPWEEKT